MTLPKFVSTKLDLIEIANKVLCDVDPAKTGSNMNEDMDREYENEAALLAEYFVGKENMMLSTALTRTFNEQFGEGVYDTALLREAYRKINEYLV